MGKKVTAHVIVGNDKGEQVTLVPGDEVPSGYTVPDEYLEGHDDVADADHTREQMLIAAKRAGIDPKSLSRHSKDQIAHAIREKLFATDVPGAEVNEEAETLTKAENKGGNANAFPATGESTAARKSSGGSGS